LKKRHIYLALATRGASPPRRPTGKYNIDRCLSNFIRNEMKKGVLTDELIKAQAIKFAKAVDDKEYLRHINDFAWLEKTKKKHNLSDTTNPLVETTQGLPQDASLPALDTSAELKSSNLTISTSPASPTLDDARRAFETFLKYVKLAASQLVVSDDELQIISKLAKRMHVNSEDMECRMGLGP
jgi:hypothetical protein